jgi:hypothetical protein
MRAVLIADEESAAFQIDLLRHDIRISVQDVSEMSGIVRSSYDKILIGDGHQISRHCIRLPGPLPVLRWGIQGFHQADRNCPRTGSLSRIIEQIMHIHEVAMIPRKLVQYETETRARKAWFNQLTANR